MKTTRRGFFKTAGLGTAAGLIGGTTLITPSVLAQTRHNRSAGVFDNGIIQLSQNESGRGPGPRVLEAIRAHTSKRVGRGYAPDYVPELQDAIASHFNIDRSNVILASGSTWLLQGSVHAFVSEDKPLVTAGPTFSTSEATARGAGLPVTLVPLNSEAKLDLPEMVKVSKGAGLVYLCNPNNPSGTVHGPETIDAVVRAILRESPDTYIHLDEAYIDYGDPAKIQTGLALTQEFKNVFITRSFSKAHALAGMRIGYAMGNRDTLNAIRNSWGMGDVSMLGAIAALTAFEDREHIEWEREENNRVKTFTVGALNDLGYDVPESHTNHLFVDLRAPARRFREACMERKVAVGRDFPPWENTHCRISLGSMEEMEVAVSVFREVLS